jgi:uncharacterized protein
MPEYNTPDDIFECRLCGRCCRGFGGTYVTGRDILRICEHIQADPDTFVIRYCDMTGAGPVLSQGPDDFCIFFDAQNHCTIHPVKPRMCSTWPFLETLLQNPENWDAMASACPGMKPSIPHPDLKRIVSDQIKNRRL